jgi:hypothetical protein
MGGARFRGMPLSKQLAIISASGTVLLLGILAVAIVAVVRSYRAGPAAASHSAAQSPGSSQLIGPLPKKIYPIFAYRAPSRSASWPAGRSSSTSGHLLA